MYPDECAPLKMLEYCFSNNNYNGHFTGSAWIVSPDKNQILMHHHKKINKWLQFGGHADGEENLLKVAMREAREESGIQHFTKLSTEIFDLDIHEIPEQITHPAHKHYDVRFIFEADPLNSKVIVSDESYDVKWVYRQKAVKLNPELSIKRMVQKTLLMKNS